jgi:hypothetical protein
MLTPEKILADALDEAIAPIDLDRNTPEENANHLYASLIVRGWTLVHTETMASHFRVPPGGMCYQGEWLMPTPNEHEPMLRSRFDEMAFHIGCSCGWDPTHSQIRGGALWSSHLPLTDAEISGW